MRTKAILAGLVALLAFGAAPVLADSTFDMLPFGSSFIPGALYLSADGQALVASWNGYHYWTEDGAVPILVTGYSPPAINISGDGNKAVASVTDPDDDKLHAAIYDVATMTWTQLDDLPEGESCDNNFSSGWACNYDGSVVGGMTWIANCRAGATRWDDGTPTSLHTIPGTSSRVSTVADDASMMGGWAYLEGSTTRRPAIWTDDVAGPQFFLGDGPQGEVYDINPVGSEAVGVANGFAFHYDFDTETFSNIGNLYGDPYGSAATGISAEGTVVGYSGHPIFSTLYGFIWTAEAGIMYMGDYLTAMGVIGYNGEHITVVRTISDDGMTIVGGFVPEGEDFSHPFIVHIEDLTAAFLSLFDFDVSAGAVDFRFEISGDATASDLKLVASKNADTWTVPVEGMGESFSAHDRSPILLQGGEVTYSLYYHEDGDAQLLRSETIDLGTQVLSTRLLGAHPNPFNPETKITFSLAESQRVSVSVVDMMGRRVADLANDVFGAGQHSVHWNGRNHDGNSVASGVYLVQMASETGGLERQKVVLLK